MYELRGWPLVDLSRGHWTKAGPTCRACTYMSSLASVALQGVHEVQPTPIQLLKDDLFVGPDQKRKRGKRDLFDDITQRIGLE